jgi:hypothetical protein
VEILILQVFVSLLLVAGSLLLFAYSARHRDHQHSGHLALLPLENERSESAPTREPSENPDPERLPNEHHISRHR